MIDLNIDDLGYEGGSRFFQDGGKARELACFWQPQALGNRPIDWRFRDLIVGGACRDPRNWAIRTLIKNQHPRFFRDTANFPEKERKQIARCRAFTFFHYLSLLRFEDHDPKRVEQLIRCCPNLFLIESDNGEVLRNCDLSKLCPFCLTRTANDVYERIAVKLSTSSPTALALASVTTDVKDSLLCRSDASSNKLSQLRSELVGPLQDLFKRLGARGGLTTVQFGPLKQDTPVFDDGELRSDNDTGFSARAALLVELPENILVRLHGPLSNAGDVEAMPYFCDLCDVGQVHAAIRMHDTRDALRSLYLR